MLSFTSLPIEIFRRINIFCYYVYPFLLVKIDRIQHISVISILFVLHVSTDITSTELVFDVMSCSELSSPNRNSSL